MKNKFAPLSEMLIAVAVTLSLVGIAVFLVNNFLL